LSFGSKFQPEAVRAVPLHRLFIETDEAEESIDEIGLRIAGIKGISPEELVGAIHKNVREVFFKR
jgi:TatD DNase family protein